MFPHPKSHEVRIPVETVIDGTDVTGEVVNLWPNDISVVMHTPVSGLGTGLHIPWFQAGYRRFHLQDEAGALTAYGLECARELLGELYAYAQGRPTGWGMSRVSRNGIWTDIDPEDL